MIFTRKGQYHWSSIEGYTVSVARSCKNNCHGICQCETWKFTAWAPAVLTTDDTVENTIKTNAIIGCYIEAEHARIACQEHYEIGIL